MQIIKYRWEKWRPLFIIRDDGKLTKLDLLNNDISFKLGKKRCIGYYKSGKYRPCPDNVEIESGWSCNDCVKKDDFFMCVKCDGSGCINEKQRKSCKKNKYFIYLASFDSILKVGISYEFRLLERFVEQGADMAAKIAVVKDGKEARQIEQRIKKYLNITDRVRGESKNIFGDPNKSIVNILDSIDKLMKAGFDLIEPEIFDLRRYYNLQNITKHPSLLTIKDDIKLIGNVFFISTR
ncbi:DUF2797 domain-containing protein [Candidatus Aenigmatarchaeota archaeon]